MPAKRPQIYKLINCLVAGIWLVNGLFCKLIGMAPRHELIVSNIVGGRYAHTITQLIGIAELLMAIWILSGIGKRLNALTQIVVIMGMNIIEFFMVQDLLLWGKLNLVFAALLSGLIYFNTFVLYKTQVQPEHV